jgi:hypothetical protein
MAEEIPTAGASRLEPLSVLWRAFAAPQTLMVLLGLVALALALVALIPQIPSHALGDAQSWLALQSGPLASGNSLVRVLGLYDVYHAFWFRLLFVLTGLTFFVWMVDAAELAWRVSRRKAWPGVEFAHWGAQAAQVCVSSSLQPEDALVRLRAFLTEHGYRWADVPDLPAPNLVAARRGIVLWSQVVAFAALLLALIGLAIASAWGWEDPDWQPAPGDTWAVGHDTSYHVRLDSFEPKSETDDRLCDYRSQITWLEGTMPTGQTVVGNGRPASLRGIGVHQVGYVPAVKLRVWDETGRPLALQAAGAERSVTGRVDVFFASLEAQPLVFLPGRDLLISFAFGPSGGDRNPSLRVNLVHDGGANPELLGVLPESGSLAADDLRLEVDLTYRPLLRLSHRPGMELVLAGLSLGLVALVLGWLVPARLVWIAIAPGKDCEALARLLTPPGTNRGRWLEHLATRLDEVLADDA